MKIYKLSMKDEFDGWDYYDEMIVRANDAKQARKIANDYDGSDSGGFWKDPKKTSCRQVKIEGSAGILVSSFIAG